MAFETKRASTSLNGPVDHGTGKRARYDEREATPSEEDSATAWSPCMHRAFVEAVMKTGISQASPSVIQQEMTLNIKDVTTERIKSKLQKYRRSKDKSLELFMKEYDEWMEKAENGIDSAAIRLDGSSADSQNDMSRMGAPRLLGGEAAALLTQRVMSEEGSSPNADILGTTKAKDGRAILQNVSQLFGDHPVIQIPVPVLSEAEKESAIGRALFHVMGIMESLSEQRALTFATTQRQEIQSYQSEALYHNGPNMTDKRKHFSPIEILRQKTLEVAQPLGFSRVPTFETNQPSMFNSDHHANYCYEDRKDHSSALAPLPFDTVVEPVPWGPPDSDCSSVFEAPEGSKGVSAAHFIYNLDNKTT